MEQRTLSTLLTVIAIAVLIAAACPALFAQGPAPESPTTSLEPVKSPVVSLQPTFETHRFMDKQNRILFVAVAAFNGADFAVTRSNLQSGGQELNPLVRPFAHSTAALATNFAIQTVGVVTVSYFLHKTGHHHMERLTSYINIGSSAGAVTYGLLHR